MKYFIKEYETRYFAGIEIPEGINYKNKNLSKIPKYWDIFYKEICSKIDNQIEPNHYIGLEVYPFDFKETGIFDYNILAETKKLIIEKENIITKKLNKGRYICFPINYSNVFKEIQKVYQYINDQNIKIHKGFDYEDYLLNENYK